MNRERVRLNHATVVAYLALFYASERLKLPLKGILLVEY